MFIAHPLLRVRDVSVLVNIRPLVFFALTICKVIAVERDIVIQSLSLTTTRIGSLVAVTLILSQLLSGLELVGSLGLLCSVPRLLRHCAQFGSLESATLPLDLVGDLHVSWLRIRW